MTRKQRRMTFVLVGLAALGIAAALVLTAFQDSIVYFHSPTDIATRPDLRTDRRLVKQGTWHKGSDGLTHRFVVTDTAHDVSVTYKGIVPDLFREGQGVVIEGRLQPDGSFRADEVLAKHDEKYMPKEVADSLKKAGLWKGANSK